MWLKTHIGLRTIKTGIAVFVCLIIAQLLNMKYPFYAVIASVIAMEKTFADSFLAGKKRIAGTIVGAFIGIIVGVYLPVNPVICSLCIVLLITICNKIHVSNAVVVACVTFSSILLNPHNESVLVFGLSRLFDTSLGIIVAIVVNQLVFPFDTLSILTEQMIQLSNEINEYLIQFSFAKKSDIQSIIINEKKVNSTCEMCLKDQSMKKSQNQQWSCIYKKSALLEKMSDHIQIIEQVKEMAIPLLYNINNEKVIETVYEEAQKEKETVIQYHYKILADAYFEYQNMKEPY